MIIIIIYLLIGVLVTAVLANKELVAFKDIGFSFIAWPIVLISLILK